MTGLFISDLHLFSRRSVGQAAWTAAVALRVHIVLPTIRHRDREACRNASTRIPAPLAPVLWREGLVGRMEVNIQKSQGGC